MSGSVWLIVGSVVFMLGAAIGLPSVFMTADYDERFRIVTGHVTRWGVAQFGYSFGPLIASVGVVVGLETDGAAGIVQVLGV